MDILRQDHSAANTHLDRILAPTIFSVRTGRRLFRGMVGVAETQSWHSAFRVLAAKSRWDLEPDVIDRHMAAAFQLLMEVLSGQEGFAKKLDPSGESSLHLAKQNRIDVLRNRLNGDQKTLQALARESFGLADWEVPFWDLAETNRPWKERGGYSGPKVATLSD